MMRMKTRCTMPSPAKVKRELKALREFIDANVMTNPVEARVAYIWETAIRWATEETTWPDPIEHIETDAEIVRREVHDDKATTDAKGVQD